MALMAGGEEESTAVRQGVQYLLNTQKPDGSWEELYFTGTGFPKHFFIRYHNYRNCFPLMALGQYLHQVKTDPESRIQLHRMTNRGWTYFLAVEHFLHLHSLDSFSQIAGFQYFHQLGKGPIDRSGNVSLLSESDDGSIDGSQSRFVSCGPHPAPWKNGSPRLIEQ